MSKIEQLRKELTNARNRLVKQGWKWDGESGNLMDIKPFEIAYQEAIEKVFPDYIWWQLTNYWDIFDAMMSGINDEDIIEEIIAHIDPKVLDEAFEENEMGAKIESGHTIEEYREKFGSLYDEGELCDFSEEDFLDGAIEINPDITYWKIEVDGAPRYFETCEECVESELEKEDDKAVSKLTEGTSNFPVHSDFDLLVFYTIDEFYNMIRYNSDYPNEEDFTQDLGEGDFHVDYEAYENACQEFEDKMWKENEVRVLDEDEVERLKDKLDDFNDETQRIADERYDFDFEDNDERTYDDLANLEDIKLSVQPGYYAAAYIDVDNEDSIKYMGEAFGAKQRERIANFLEELRKEFHLTKLGVAWGPASNGETGFKIIKEAKKEPKNKGSKKARFVGNPEVEKTFFNVANGTCTSCALSEAKKESYEELFDDLIGEVEFKLVKYSGEDRKSKSTWDEKEYEGDWGLIDLQGANLGGIEDERFNNAKEIIDRLDTYITDYFLGGQDGLEVSEKHQDELDTCYTNEDMLEFFKKYPEEDKDGHIVKILDFIVNHAQDVDLEKCTFEEFGEGDKGSEVWVLKFIDKDGNQIKEMGKPMALDCTKALAKKLVDTMNKYPGRVGMTHEIEKAPYADTMSYEIIDSDDVEEWISKIEAEGKAAHGEESNESLKEDISDDILAKVDELRDACKNLSAEELYKTASNEHLWALGSKTDKEATMHEINADAYRILAKEKESKLNEVDLETSSTKQIEIKPEKKNPSKEEDKTEIVIKKEEPVEEGAQGKKEPGKEFVVFDASTEGKAPILGIRSTRVEAEWLMNRLMKTGKYDNVSYDEAPKGRFHKGDDFFGPFDESLKEGKVDVAKCKDILNNQIDWTEVDEYGDVDFARYQLRSLHSNEVISDDEYNYIISHWDELLDLSDLQKESLKEEKPFVCPRPVMKHKKIKEAKEDSVSWFESVKCYGAPGDEPSEVYEPGQGAYCLVDKDGLLVDRLEKHEREAILDQLIKGGAQFAIPGTDVEYEIEFAGDCDWDEAYPHILRMFKQGKLNGVFKLNKKQEYKEEAKSISGRVLKSHKRK